MTAAERLAALSPDARAAALAVLDEISRPMTKIEIETALREHLPRSVRRPTARGLEALNVIAVDLKRC